MKIPKSFAASLLSTLIAIAVTIIAAVQGAPLVITVGALLAALLGGGASFLGLREARETQKQIDYLGVPESVRTTYRNLYQRGEGEQ
jgi:hypothetical protein